MNYDEMDEKEQLEFLEAERDFLEKRIQEKKDSIAEGEAKIQADVDSEIADLAEENAGYGEQD